MDSTATLLESLSPRNDLVSEPSYLQFKHELDTALISPTIKNIAIAGPYSSGKSSLIETYKKNVNDQMINVSLASFNLSKGPDDNNVTENSDVEESILKNILYSVAPSKIPKSSYSRISAITKKEFNKGALIFLLFILIGVLLILPKEISSGLIAIGLTDFKVIINNDFFDLFFSRLTPFIDIVRVVLIGFWFIFFTLYLSKYIWKISSFRFKAKVSASGLDIASNENSLERKSYLNSRLDELLYFFEMNKDKRVVVFEDLDRLSDLSIFIKLREINHLLNQYKNIKEKIVFIYAIRDDIFTNNERVKFFDLIIPVIPFVDNSNSYEVLREKIKLDKGYFINERVIKELSYYIDDPRLLSNIISEFRYYAKRLGWGGDKNLDKLLALMVYKNIVPQDFSELQQGNGELSRILEYISGNGLNNLLLEKNNKINSLKEQLETTSRVPVIDIKKNKKIFLYSIFQHVLNDNVQITGHPSPIRLSQVLDDDELFGKLLNSDDISGWNNSRSLNQNQLNLIYEEYLGHEEVLNSNKLEQQNKLRDQISSIESEVARIRSKGIGEIALQLIDNGFEEEISKLSKSWSDTSLIKYIVTADLISHDFSLYISEYHEGSKTKRDMDFLKMISSKGTLESYSSKLDNPIVVLNELQPSHFSNKNILNIDLITHLLSIQDEKNAEVREFIKLLRTEDKVTDFISEYLTEAHKHKDFFNAVSKYWYEFSNWVITSHDFDSQKKQDIITLVLVNISVDLLVKQNAYAQLTNFLNDKKSFPPSIRIDSVGDVRFYVNKNKSIFHKLGLNFKHLKLTYLDKEVIDLVIDGNYYEINRTMVLGLAKHRIINFHDYKKSILTGILTLPDDDKFRLRIISDLEIFIQTTMLHLKDNKHESIETLAFLSNQDIAKEYLPLILEQTETQIVDIKKFNSELWGQLLDSKNIENNWSIIITYFQKYDLDDTLSEYLNNGYLNIKGSPNDCETEFFQSVFIDESKLSINCYQELVTKIKFQIEGGSVLEDLNFERLNILIQNKKIKVDEGNIEYLDSRNDGLVVDFIINMAEELHEKNLLIHANFDQDTKASLFRSAELNIKIKKILLSEITEDELENEDLATEVNIFALSNKEQLPNRNCLDNVLTWSNDLKLKVEYLTFVADTLADDELREALQLLESPFDEILTNNNHTKLDDNNENKRLVDHLISRGWISKTVDLKKVEQFKAIPNTSAIINIA